MWGGGEEGSDGIYECNKISLFFCSLFFFMAGSTFGGPSVFSEEEPDLNNELELSVSQTIKYYAHTLHHMHLFLLLSPFSLL